MHCRPLNAILVSMKLTRSQRAQLRAARKRAGLTQLQLAAELNVDPASLARWERGDVAPSRFLLPLLRARFPEIFPPGDAS